MFHFSDCFIIPVQYIICYVTRATASCGAPTAAHFTDGLEIDGNLKIFQYSNVLFVLYVWSLTTNTIWARLTKASGQALPRYRLGVASLPDYSTWQHSPNGADRHEA